MNNCYYYLVEKVEYCDITGPWYVYKDLKDYGFFKSVQECMQMLSNICKGLNTYKPYMIAEFNSDKDKVVKYIKPKQKYM